jgi:hypothetical protein
MGPSARYTRDLVNQGYVGDLRSARLSVGVNAFAPIRPGRFEWTFDASNVTHVLSVYAGHFLDLGERIQVLRSREVAQSSPDPLDRSVEMTESNGSPLLKALDLIRNAEMRDQLW